MTTDLDDQAGGALRQRPAGRRPAARGARPAWRDARAILVLALAAALALPVAAGAHGGTLLGSAVAGPYRTQVTGAPLREAGKPPAIDITVYVSDAASGTPVDDARVRTTVHLDGRAVSPMVRRIAGGYEAVVPDTGDARIGRQRIDVQLAGSLGIGTLRIDPIDDGGGPPTALVVATVVVLAGLLGLVLRVRRRRVAAGPDDEDLWPD